MMQGYKNWCPATTSASSEVEAMSKSSVTVCTSNGSINGLEINSFFFNSPLELTFWITYILWWLARKTMFANKMTILLHPRHLGHLCFGSEILVPPSVITKKPKTISLFVSYFSSIFGSLLFCFNWGNLI
jgi:hypothetical protein